MNETQNIIFKYMSPIEARKLSQFYQELSFVSKSRFAPHDFEQESIMSLFADDELHWGYIALNGRSDKIVGYVVVKIGFPDGDKSRFESYGFQENRLYHCTLAPAVADAWQNMGLGQQLFDFAVIDLKYRGFKQVFLWGGVQEQNDRAVRFYKRNGFEEIGMFEYKGQNLDMMCPLVHH